MLAPFLAALTWAAVGADPAANLDMAPTARLRALPDSVLTITRLQYEGGGDWYAHPSALPHLLAALRARTGVKLSNIEWRALLDTDLDAEQHEREPEAFEEETAGWFESSYLWSRVTMASYTRATITSFTATGTSGTH